MASKPSWQYYKKLGDMSRIRALAESVFNGRNASGSPRIISAAEAYHFSCLRPHVTVTDWPMDLGSVKRLGLPSDAKVLNDNHGATVGRSAEARVFYNQLAKQDKDKLEAPLPRGPLPASGQAQAHHRRGGPGHPSGHDAQGPAALPRRRRLQRLHLAGQLLAPGRGPGIRDLQGPPHPGHPLYRLPGVEIRRSPLGPGAASSSTRFTRPSSTSACAILASGKKAP